MYIWRAFFSETYLKRDTTSQTCDYETKKKKYDVDDEDDKKYGRRDVHRYKGSAARRRKTEKLEERFTLYAFRSLRYSGGLYAFLVSLVLHIRFYIVDLHVRREALS